MSDLKSLQDRLNKDEKLRNKFLEDPVKTLEGEGVVVDAAMKTAIAKSIAEVKRKPSTAPGASAAARARIRISIGIKVSAENIPDQ